MGQMGITSFGIVDTSPCGGITHQPPAIGELGNPSLTVGQIPIPATGEIPMPVAHAGQIGNPSAVGDIHIGILAGGMEADTFSGIMDTPVAAGDIHPPPYSGGMEIGS